MDNITVADIPVHIWTTEIFSYLEQDLLIGTIRLVCKSFNLKNLPLFTIKRTKNQKRIPPSLTSSITSIQHNGPSILFMVYGLSRTNIFSFDYLNSISDQMCAQDLSHLNSLEIMDSAPAINYSIFANNKTLINLKTFKCTIKNMNQAYFLEYLRSIEDFEVENMTEADALFMVHKPLPNLVRLYINDDVNESVLNNIMESKGVMKNIKTLKLGSIYTSNIINKLSKCVNVNSLESINLIPYYYSTEIKNPATFEDYIKLLKSSNLPRLRSLKFPYSVDIYNGLKFITGIECNNMAELILYNIYVPELSGPGHSKSFGADIEISDTKKVSKVTIQNILASSIGKSKAYIANSHRLVTKLLSAFLCSRNTYNLTLLETCGIKWSALIDDLVSSPHFHSLKKLTIRNSDISVLSIHKVLMSTSLMNLEELVLSSIEYPENEALFDILDTDMNVYEHFDVSTIEKEKQVPNDKLKKLEVDHLSYQHSIYNYIISGCIVGLEELRITQMRTDPFVIDRRYYTKMSLCNHFERLTTLHITDASNGISIIMAVFTNNNLTALSNLILERVAFNDSKDTSVFNPDENIRGPRLEKTLKIIDTDMGENYYEDRSIMDKISDVLRLQNIRELILEKASISWTAFVRTSKSFSKLKTLKSSVYREDDDDIYAILALIFSNEDRREGDCVLEVLHIHDPEYERIDFSKFNDNQIYANLKEFVFD